MTKRNPEELSLTAFERALGIDAEGSAANGCLVQLGLSRPNQVVVWCVPPRGRAFQELSVRSADGASLLAEVLYFDLDPARNTQAARIVVAGLLAHTQYDLIVSVNGEQRRILVATAPEARDSASFSFVGFSCFAPFSSSQPNLATLQLLELARESGARKPSFMLGFGDQIYVDDGAWPKPAARSLIEGLHNTKLRYDGSASSFFDALYRAHFAVEPFGEVLSRLPAAMIWDDHEIRDGWGSQGDEEKLMKSQRWQQHLAAARRWFVGYQGLRNPPLGGCAPGEPFANQDAPDSPLGPEMHFSFDWGALATFFVMDLRSQRTCRRVVSEQQLAAMQAWLCQPRREGGRVYVLVSPIPLTLPVWPVIDPARFMPFRADDARDQWWSESGRCQGKQIRKYLVDHFSEFPQDRLLVLSGDVHYSEARAIALSEGDERVIGHEIVSSGLAQSSFFARSECMRRLEEWFPEFVDEQLTSRSLGRYHGASFVELFVGAGADNGTPRVEVRFHTGAGASERRVELTRDATRTTGPALFAVPPAEK